MSTYVYTQVQCMQCGKWFLTGRSEEKPLCDFCKVSGKQKRPEQEEERYYDTEKLWTSFANMVLVCRGNANWDYFYCPEWGKVFCVAKVEGCTTSLFGDRRYYERALAKENLGEKVRDIP